MSVNAEHIDFYRKQGYVVIESGLSDFDLEPVINDQRAVVDDMAAKLYERGEIVDLDAEGTFGSRLARLLAACPEHQVFPDIGVTRGRGTFDFIRNSKLIDLVEAFVGPEITCNAVSHIRPKFPETDVAFHQDAVFTTQAAQDILQVTVWVPLVDVNEQNGCLSVQPGIHLSRMVYWSYSRDLPSTEIVSLPMKKGDVLFVHKLTPHGSGINRTSEVRWSMDLRYQRTGDASPRPEWPSLVARSRRYPGTETNYESWRDAWVRALAKTPEQIRYERPTVPLPFTGEMFI